MERNFCWSQIGRKRKHSSLFKNLSSVSEDVVTGQWLVVLKPAPEESKRSNTARRLPALSGAVVCHVHDTAPIDWVKQLSQEAPLAR